MAELGLGTAQIGLPYGLSGAGNDAPPREGAAILAEARSLGIELFDTAPAYGAAEATIGTVLGGDPDVRVVTKIPALAGPQGTVRGEILGSVRRSLARVGVARLHAVLMHKADDLLGPQREAAWSALTEARDLGLVGAVGVSVYTRSDVDALLSRYDLDAVQLPLNVLDQRLVASGQLRDLRAAGVEIHARSVFLQGALLMPPEGLPGHLDALREPLRRWSAALQAAEIAPLMAALAYVRSVAEVDAVVVGVDSVTQTRALVSAWESAMQVEMDFDSFGVEDPALDPRRWPAPDAR